MFSSHQILMPLIEHTFFVIPNTRPQSLGQKKAFKELFCTKVKRKLTLDHGTPSEKVTQAGIMGNVCEIL